MWDALSRAELDAAKALLKSRREEMLRRHAEELNVLKRDEAEIDTLDHLIGAFVSKFNTVTSSDASVETGRRVAETKQAGELPNAPGISLFITQTQKSDLRAMGVDDEQIRHLKPDEAHRMLGLAS